MKKIKEIIYYIVDLLLIPIFLGTIPYKLNKDKWYFKKGDPDINPSFPHLHSIDNKFKMNIYTGDIYTAKTKMFKTTINDEDYIKLWSDNKFRQSVLEMRKLYPYDKSKLPEMTNVIDKNNLNRNSVFE